MTSSSIDTREIRKFGLIVLVLFGSLCGLGIWKAKPFPTYFFGFLTFLGICFVLIPSWSAPVYRGWLKVAHFIGQTITTLILALAYYFVITPAGMLKRIFGGRPLPVKFDKKASSYWVDREEPAQQKERFLKRF